MSETTSPAASSRPWPVVLLTALGAWLAAVPLVAMIVMLLGSALRGGIAPLVIGAGLLVGAVLLLRAAALPLFVEQLAVPLLLTGGACLAWGLANQLQHQEALVSALMLGVCVIVAVAVPRSWLRLLLGAGAAGLGLLALQPEGWLRLGSGSFIEVHLLLAAWLAMWLAAPRAPAGIGSLLEDFACGWLMSCLLLLAVLDGYPAGAWLSTGLALAAGAWAAWSWAGLRRWPLLLAGAVLVALAWPMSHLGALLLAIAVTACSGRWRQATAAALAAAWVVGHFYFELDWPLAQKALWLAAGGAVLVALAALLARARMVAGAGGYRWAAGLCALAVLAVANGLIWQKEALIREGAPVYVALVPVDPRSLMQGDYMRLAFALPPQVQELPFDSGRPRVVLALDERRIARPLRIAGPGQGAGAGELLMELAPKDGRWILVTDAWFFREGRAEQFARARYGEFRVLPDGRALLVGLADEALHPLMP